MLELPGPNWISRMALSPMPKPHAVLSKRSCKYLRARLARELKELKVGLSLVWWTSFRSFRRGSMSTNQFGGGFPINIHSQVEHA